MLRWSMSSVFLAHYENLIYKINTPHFIGIVVGRQNYEPYLLFCRFVGVLFCHQLNGCTPFFCYTKLALHTHMEIEAFAVLSRISESPLLAPTHKVHRVFSANLICCYCSEIAFRRWQLGTLGSWEHLYTRAFCGLPPALG